MRWGVPVAGALLFAAALVYGGGHAIVLASAAPPAPAAGPAGVISAIAGGRFHHQAMTAGDIYTIAGGGTGGLGDGGPAAHSELSAPADITLDRQGNLVLADTGHVRVRMVAAKTGRFYGRAMTAGDIYTIAGKGGAGFSGDGGPAVKARLHRPTGVALDAVGNVLISDSFNERIRVLAARTGTFYGRAMTAGDIYTIAGNGTAGYSGDGGPATAAGLYKPLRVTVDAVGNLVFCDERDNRIRVVAVRSGRFYGQAMTAGDIYTIAGTGRRGTTGDGGPATRAEVGEPAGITLDTLGNLLIATRNGGRIRVVAASTGTFYGRAMTGGDIYTIAGGGTGGLGDGGPATSAVLLQPGAVMVDTAGNVLICDTADGRIREVSGPAARLR
jgi:hypothetical protein